jgi:hypothetical protein
LRIGQDTLKWQSLEIIDAFYFGKGINQLTVTDSSSVFYLNEQSHLDNGQEGRYIKLKRFAVQTLQSFQKYPLIGKFGIAVEGDTLANILIRIKTGPSGNLNNYTINSTLRGGLVRINFPVYGEKVENDQIELTIYFGDQKNKSFELKNVTIDINDIFYNLRGEEILKFCEVIRDLKQIKGDGTHLLLTTFSSNPNRPTQPTLSSFEPIVSKSERRFSRVMDIIKKVIYVLLFIIVNSLIIYLTKPLFNKS